MNLEKKTLQRVDEFLKKITKRERYLLYIIIATLTFSTAYPFYDQFKNGFENSKKLAANIQTMIKEDRAYLDENSDIKIAKISQEIKTLDLKYRDLKSQNSYIKNKIETIPSIIYDKKVWSVYLSSISTNAKKYNIWIVNFQNSYSKNSSSPFEEILNISLSLKGSYLDTIKFINSLEDSNLAVYIEDLSIDALSSNINILVYGINHK